MYPDICGHKRHSTSYLHYAIQDYENSSKVHIAFMFIVLIGTFCAYAFQITSFLRKKTSVGISPITFQLAMLGSTITLMSENYSTMYKIVGASQGGGWPGFVTYLPYLQIASIPVAYLVYTLLYFRYASPSIKASRAYRITTIFCTLNVIFAAIVVPLSGVYNLKYGWCSKAMQNASNIAGIVASVEAFFVWADTIRTTYRDKGNGSLSLGMLCIECPGDFITFMALLLSHTNALTASSYIVSASQELVVIGMLIYYRCIKKERNDDEISESDY